jgi:hypothetical protein
MMVSRFIVLMTLALTTVNATDVLRPISPTRTLDFHGQGLVFCSLADVMLPKLHAVADAGFISLNLSNNYLDENGVKTLLSLLEQEGLLDKVTEVNLTNNRLKAKGFKALMPLIAQPSCHRILVPVNNITTTEMQDAWSDLKESAASVSRKTRQSAEELLKQWAHKIIWLQERYVKSPVADRFNVNPELDRTQREYYGITAH